MALTDSLALSQGAHTAGTGSVLTFVTTKRGNTETERIDNTTDLQSPRLLIVRHQTNGKEGIGNGITDRHLFQLSKVERDVNGKAFALQTNLTMVVPRVGLFDSSDVYPQLRLLCNFLATSANIDALLRGES